MGVGPGRVPRRQVQICGHGAPAKPPHLPPCSPAPASSPPDIHSPPVRREAPHICPVSQKRKRRPRGRRLTQAYTVIHVLRAPSGHPVRCSQHARPRHPAGSARGGGPRPRCGAPATLQASGWQRSDGVLSNSPGLLIRKPGPQR